MSITMASIKRDVGSPDWANMPRDVLCAVLRESGINPLSLAGVCKGWRWLLDEEVYRTSVLFTYCVADPSSLHEAVRSFSLFMCTRPPVTVDLAICLSVPMGEEAIAAAALGPVLVHLAPRLQTLRLDHVHVAPALVASPFVDMCARLDFLRSFVERPLDLGRMRTLEMVDLTLVGVHAEIVALPPGLTSCRLQVYDNTTRPALTTLLALLPTMRRLRTLAVYSDHECTLDVAALAPTLATIIIDASKEVRLELHGASFPDLAVFGIRKCNVSAVDLSAFLQRCRRIRALSCADYRFDDIIAPTLDLRHLPLKAAALVTSPYRARLRCVFPSGVRALTLGHGDIEDALEQPDVVATVQMLALVDMEHMDPRLFELVWPAQLFFPRLTDVKAAGCTSPQLAALLGQRCWRACLTLDMFLVSDIETDDELYGF